MAKPSSDIESTMGMGIRFIHAGQQDVIDRKLDIYHSCSITIIHNSDEYGQKADQRRDRKQRNSLLHRLRYIFHGFSHQTSLRYSFLYIFNGAPPFHQLY